MITTWFPPEEEISIDGNLTIIRLKSKRKRSYQSNPIEMSSWMKMAIRYIRQNSDIANHSITLTNFSFPGGPVALAIKKKYNIPFVLVSHAHDIPWYYPKKMFFWHLLLYYPIKYICLQSAYNIVVADEMKILIDKFIGQKYAKKNIVINNGLHIGDFKKNIDGQCLRLLFIGRLVAQKSPFVFLNAIKELNKYNIPIEASILGDGELRDKMEEWIWMNGITNIDVKGKVSHHEVYTELQNAHLLISTSQNEGMSMAILEAISTGVYVIATPVSGNESMIIEDVNGNFVPFDDYKTIALKVKDFYFEKVLKNYTYPDYYVKKIEESFAWKNIAKQYLDLMNDVVKLRKID